MVFACSCFSLAEILRPLEDLFEETCCVKIRSLKLSLTGFGRLLRGLNIFSLGYVWPFAPFFSIVPAWKVLHPLRLPKALPNSTISISLLLLCLAILSEVNNDVGLREFVWKLKDNLGLTGVGSFAPNC